MDATLLVVFFRYLIFDDQSSIKGVCHPLIMCWLNNT